MTPEAAAMRDFLPVYTIAYVDREDYRLIAGFLSSDVMWLDHPTGAAILAIGNIGTSPLLKGDGLRGVGTALLERAIAIAQEELSQDGKELLCVATEAEPASLGFWKKRGFLWAQGCHYLQPPLEWDDEGAPVHEEVPETLLMAPVQMSADSAAPSLVRSIIVAIYDNWCLRVWRGHLLPAGMARAQEYVMGRVLGKVMATMPKSPMALTTEYPKVSID